MTGITHTQLLLGLLLAEAICSYFVWAQLRAILRSKFRPYDILFVIWFHTILLGKLAALLIDMQVLRGLSLVTQIFSINFYYLLVVNIPLWVVGWFDRQIELQEIKSKQLAPLVLIGNWFLIPISGYLIARSLILDWPVENIYFHTYLITFIIAFSLVVFVLKQRKVLWFNKLYTPVTLTIITNVAIVAGLIFWRQLFNNIVGMVVIQILTTMIAIYPQIWRRRRV